MKCPNCGNEAINVNGKYVCLDCGVEISANQTGDDLTASLEPKLTNHEGATEVETTPVNQENTIPVPTPSSVTQEPAAPVKEAFLNELSKEEPTSGASGVYDFTSNDIPQSSPAVDVPTPEPVGVSVPVNASVQDDFGGPSAPQPDPEVQEIPQINDQGNLEPQSVENTWPVPEVSETEKSYFEEPQPVAVAEQNETPVTPTQEAPVQPEAPTNPEPIEDYFQPAKIDITPQNQEENQIGQAVPDSEQNFGTPTIPTMEASTQEPAPEITVEPTPEVTEPVIPQPETSQQPVSVPVEPAQAEVPQAPVFEQPTTSEPNDNPGANLDDLLDKYSTNQGPGFPPATQAIPNGTTAFDSLRPQTAERLPEQNVMVGGMPSTESVFGTEGLDDPTVVMEQTQKKTKKLRIIVAVAVGFVLLVLIVVGVVLGQLKAKQNAAVKRAEVVQSIMSGVSKKMDEPLDVRVSFRHSLDFTNVNLKPKVDPDLGKNLLSLFSAPIINEGRWDTNNNGDILQANKSGATFYEQVYIDTEKMTYFKENGAWGKKDGREITAIPGLYSAIERGSIFYPSKVESLQLVKVEESEDGETLTTLRVNPKADYMKEIITAVAPALSKVNFEKIDVSALNIEVTVDDSNYIQGVVAKGDIDVICDYFVGKIAVDSEAVYEYSASEIEKPELSQKTPLIILTNTVVQGDFENTPQKEATEGRG